MDIFISQKQTKMLKKHTYILVLGLTASLFSCSESETTDNSNPAEAVEDNQIEAEETNLDEVEMSNEDDVDSRPVSYNQDWEVFKAAVINKDIKGVSAFASSDKVDSEFLVRAFQEPDFLDVLKETNYSDLTVELSDGEEVRVYSCELKGTDQRGNKYESGLYMYFTQGESGLLLDNFIAAG